MSNEIIIGCSWLTVYVVTRMVNLDGEPILSPGYIGIRFPRRVSKQAVFCGKSDLRLGVYQFLNPLPKVEKVWPIIERLCSCFYANGVFAGLIPKKFRVGF